MNSGVVMPAMTLAGWTLCVLLLIPWRRFQAARQGLVNPDDFKLGESSRVPDVVCLANRNYMNLLELPILFYFLSVVLLITQEATAAIMVLMWLYVSLRVIHSLIHLTYNHVFHRLTAFASSNLVLLVLWLMTLSALAGSASSS